MLTDGAAANAKDAGANAEADTAANPGQMLYIDEHTTERLPQERDEARKMPLLSGT